MIHKIKAMYDAGRGSSMRAIAAELKISRNTVRKYLAMSAEEISAYQAKKRRARRLDVHRSAIVDLLERYPRLSAVKVLRKLREAHGDLSVSDRSARRYIQALKERRSRSSRAVTTSRWWTWRLGCNARSTAGSCAGC